MEKQPSHKGKRFIEEKPNKKKFLIPIILVAIIVVVAICIWLNCKKINEYIPTNTDETNTIVENPVTEINTVKELETVDVSELPNKMGSYKVIGELVIDKIDVKKNIREKFDIY